MKRLSVLMLRSLPGCGAILFFGIDAATVAGASAYNENFSIYAL